jgi:CRP-like cAMP-binding protein
MALVDDAPRSTDVFAHGGPAVVYVLTRAVFRELLASGAPEGAGAFRHHLAHAAAGRDRGRFRVRDGQGGGRHRRPGGNRGGADRREAQNLAQVAGFTSR